MPLPDDEGRLVVSAAGNLAKIFLAATFARYFGALVLGLALTLAVFVWGKLHSQRYGEYSLEEAELNKVVAG